jgi:hypothetical protein
VRPGAALLLLAGLVLSGDNLAADADRDRRG